MKPNEQELDNLNRLIEDLFAKLDYTKIFLQELDCSKDSSEYEAILDRFNGPQPIRAVDTVQIEFSLIENLFLNHIYLVTVTLNRLLNNLSTDWFKKEDLEFICEQIPKNNWFPSPSVPTQDELKTEKFHETLKDLKVIFPKSYQLRAILVETFEKVESEIIEMNDLIIKNRQILDDITYEIGHLLNKALDKARDLGILK